MKTGDNFSTCTGTDRFGGGGEMKNQERRPNKMKYLEAIVSDTRKLELDIANRIDKVLIS